MIMTTNTSIGTNPVNIVTLHMSIEKGIQVCETPVNDYEVAKAIFQKEIGDKDREYFALLCLDTKGNPTHFSIIHIGTLNSALIHPREIFKLAILSNANAIIVAHNHPSGSLEPSFQDIENTKIIAKAGKILGIPVLDHIIVSFDMALSIRNKEPQVFEELN